MIAINRKLSQLLWALILLTPTVAESAQPVVGVEYRPIASSELKSSNSQYSVKNIVAPSTGNAWCEGVEGDGIGEWLELLLTKPFEVNGDFVLEILPGYVRTRSIYLKNGRPKKLAIEINGVAQGVPLLLEDRAVVQEFAIKTDLKSINKIRLRIMEVYPGTHYADTCISEVAVNYAYQNIEWDEELSAEESRNLVGLFYNSKHHSMQKSGFNQKSIEFAFRLGDGMYSKGAEGREMLKEIYLEALIINPKLFISTLNLQKPAIFKFVATSIISPIDDRYSPAKIRDAVRKGTAALESPLDERWGPLLTELAGQ